MADVERIIQIVFGATDSTGTAIKSVSKNLDQISGSVSGMTEPIADAHDKVLMLEAALGALAIGGLALAVSAAGEFDDQFREITTLLDDSDENISKFKDDIKSYAQDSGQSLETINKSIYNAISAGIDYKLSVESLAQSEKLAVAGVADLDSTLLTLVGTLNAYGESSDQAEKYSDILFTTVENGITTIPQLSTSLSKVTGLAAGAGVSFESLAAHLATLTSRNVPTSEAITSLKAVLSNIIKPGQQAAEMAESLGIQFDAAALQSKGLEGVLIDVYNATNGDVGAMGQLFGSAEALNAVMTAVGQDGGALLLENLEAMRNSAGATEAAYAKMADSFQITNQNLINNVRLTFVELGENVLDEYGDIAGGVTEIFKALQEAIKAGAFDDVFGVISDLAGDLSDELFAIAENLPAALGNVDFTGFVKSIRGLADETGDLIENILGADFSTAEGLEKAIQRVVDVVTILTNVTTGIVEGWQKWAVWLEEVVDYLDDTNGEAAKSVGNFLQWGKVVHELSGLIGGLGYALSALGNILNVLAAKQLLSFTTNLNKAKTTLVDFSGDVTSISGKAGLLGMAAAVGYVAGTLLREWFPVIDEAAQKTLEFVDSLVDFTGKNEAAAKAQDTLAKAFKNYLENVQPFPGELDEIAEKLGLVQSEIDSMPRDVILKMAFDQGLIDADTLMNLIRKSKDLADANPVEVPIEFDDAQYQADMAAAIDYAEASANSADVYIEPEVIPPDPKKTEEALKTATDLIKPIVDGFYDSIQTKIEWEAKLNIAEVEANAKKIEAIMESVGESASGAADVLSSIFGNISDLREIADRYTIRDWIDEQIEIQKEALEIQKKTADAEVALMEAKRRRLENGDALISVETEGLQPQLENVIWELLGAIQTRITEEGLDMLLGV
jgi:TP901 family phage tail tape measure protein